MKIAMGTPWMVKCGIFSYSYQLCNALAQQGCEVYVVRLYRFGDKDAQYYQNYAEEFPLDVDVIHIQEEYGLYNWLDLTFYSALRQRMAQFDKKIPIVTTMHATGNLRVDRVIHSNSSAVIVHNQFGANQFRFGCRIIPMGVQKVKQPPNPDLCKRRWGVKGKTVGIFGFLSEYKGLDVVIRAIAKVPDVTLLVGGGWHVDAETPFIRGIRMYASQLAPKRVRFLGYIEDEDMPYYFGACDVMVFAHHMISESMAVNTSLAYGKPTITSNLPSFREKAKTKAVLIFKNDLDLAGKIKALLTEPELREMMINNAQKYAEKNSWNVSASKHISLYEELLEKERVGD